jgi:hypothetical protein
MARLFAEAQPFDPVLITSFGETLSVYYRYRELFIYLLAIKGS